MPNYSLQINSRFRPFSFQEMLAPWQLYGQAYKEVEDAYSALGMQAGTVEAMLNRELDKDAYNQYQGYMQGLQDQAAIIAKEGLSPEVRNTLLNMRKRYSQEIVPIQKAAERREKLAEEQRKLGNSMIFDIDASTTGLDRFLNNPSLNYQSIDRKDLRARAEAEFSKFQNELNEFKIDGNIDAYHKKLVQKYGYRPDEATDFINGVLNGDNASTLDKSLLSVYNNLYRGTQVDSWNNPNASREVMNTILEGVGAAIGKTNASIMNDEEKLAELKYRNEVRAYKQKLQDKYDFMQGHKTPDYTPPIFRLGSGNLVLTEKQAELKKNVDTYNDAINYFKEHPEEYERLANLWMDTTVSPGTNRSGRQMVQTLYAGSTGFGKRPENVEHFMNLINLSKTLSNVRNGSNLSDDDVLSAFEFNVNTDEFGRKSFTANRELGDMMQDLGTMYKPMFYNVSEKGMENMMRNIQTNVLSSTNTDDKVTLAKELDGNNASKKALSKLNWNKAELFMVGNQEYVYFKDKADEGRIIELLPGATGDFKASLDNISNYFNNRKFEDYFISATDYMADVFGTYNMQHKGQTGSTKEITDIPSVSSYYDDDLYDFDYVYDEDEDEE